MVNQSGHDGIKGAVRIIKKQGTENREKKKESPEKTLRMTGQGTGVQLLQYYLNLTSSNLSTSGRLRFRSGPCCVHPRHCLSFYFSAVSFRSLPSTTAPVGCSATEIWSPRPITRYRQGRSRPFFFQYSFPSNCLLSSTSTFTFTFNPLSKLNRTSLYCVWFPCRPRLLLSPPIKPISPLPRLARVALEPLPGPSQTTYTNNGCAPDNECLWLVTTSLNLTSPSFTFERNILPLHHEIDHHEGVS